MSNIEFSAKSEIFAPVRVGATGASRSNKQKIRLVLNIVVISAAFLFVTAAVLGLFP